MGRIKGDHLWGQVRCPAPVGDQLWERALNSASSHY